MDPSLIERGGVTSVAFSLVLLPAVTEPRQIQAEMLRIKDQPRPMTWAREHYRLTTAYARPGNFVPYKWQEEILDAIAECDLVIQCAPTQVGKSLIAEVQVAWCIDNLPMNGIVIYAKKETASDMFADRIRPMIKEIGAIKKYWSGDDDDLTQKKMRLMHMFLRIGSAEVPSDIATWSSGLIYASEVSKYRKKRGWNPVESLKRRQEAYRIIGRHKAIFESSPLFVGDCLDEEMKQSGVLNLRAYHPCPHCGKFQVLTIRQVKEIANFRGEMDHDPGRITRERAARYECIGCKATIEEKHRIAMGELVVWAADGEKIENGVVVDRKPTKKKSFQYTRFVDYSFTFAEALSRWFAAQRKGTEAMQTFMNEDMGEFWTEETIQISEDYLLKKKMDYRQYKSGEIPNEVLTLVLGADCQDDGFYYVISGFGRGMEKYLVRSGFIAVKKDETEEGKDPHQLAYERFRAGILADPFVRRDGTELEIWFGFLDRGGHRPEDVDYICQRFTQIKPYIGMSRVDFKKPVVEQSSNGEWWMGQSMILSREVTGIIASARYHLPADVTQDYLDQVRNEYIEPKIDTHGNKKLVYVKIEPNHYRSCENYVHAACKAQSLEALLFDPTTVQTLTKRPGTLTEPEAETEDDTGGGSAYLAGRRGRRV